MALKFALEERDDFEAHRDTCMRCADYDASHSCPVCGQGLTPEVEGPTCTSRWHRWRIALGFYKRSRVARRAVRARAEARHAQATARSAPAPHHARPPARPATAAPRPEARPPPAKPRAPEPSTQRAAAPPAHKPAPESAVAKARAVLGVGPDAGEKDIREAFRKKAMQYHPDRVAGLGDEFREIAEKKMRELNEARDVLEKLLAATAKK